MQKETVGGRVLPTAYCLPPTHSAFTLTEILIVIGLIVLILVLAVPALDFITGANSIDAAQNQISAMLGRARTEAIGLQEPVGVAFFRDPANDRLTMAIVDYDQNTSTAELMAERDQQLLPPGIGMQLVNDDTGDPYVGAGIILFDGFGKLVYEDYDITGTTLLTQHTNGGTVTSEFPATPFSQFGFVLYNREAYLNNQTDTWLDENALPVLVNRYNGTLVKGE